MLINDFKENTRKRAQSYERTCGIESLPSLLEEMFITETSTLLLVLLTYFLYKK